MHGREPLSQVIEEKYDQVRSLITLGKERGYLLYDEVNDALPAEVHSPEELEGFLATVERDGIEIFEDSIAAKTARAVLEVAKPMETEGKEEETESSDEGELD